MKDWLREPLVHFLIIGALLFVASATLGPNGRPDATIVVSEAVIARLGQLFSQQWQRPPTREELDRLIEQHVREEVLYREGVAMGLDRNDAIVRRRVVQKLEFLSQDLVDEEPDDAALRSFFEENRERFAEPPIISFRHVYLNPDRRADIDRDAAATLEALANGQDPAQLGDTFLLPLALMERSQRELAGMFGADFAAALAGLAIGSWQGPVVSGYGAHLVWVDAREEAYVPEFEAIIDAVRVEYLAARRREADTAMYEDLRARYRIEIAETGGTEEPEQ